MTADDDLRQKNDQLVQALLKANETIAANNALIASKDIQLAKANETNQALREVIASKDQLLVKAEKDTASKDAELMHLRLQNESLLAANSVSLDVLKVLYEKVHSLPPSSQVMIVELKKDEDGDYNSKSFIVKDDKGEETEWSLMIRSNSSSQAKLDVDSRNGNCEFIVNAELEVFGKTHKLKGEITEAKDWVSTVIMSSDDFPQKTRQMDTVLVKVEITVRQVE